MPNFPLSTIRHSAAHVLAQAVQFFYSDAKLAIGPAIDNGFYYDFELSTALNDNDLIKIEKKMNQLLFEKQKFKQYDLPTKDAKKLFKKNNQDYKLELIEDLNLATVSIYENGPFIDLCKGPHVNNTSEIGVIKLLKVSGAYWKGSEKNKMLQRIYGTAFLTQNELTDFITQQEEALKRDHRKIGKELQLFNILDDVGGGLVLWQPKGAAIRQVIEDYWRTTHRKNDYKLVFSPHIGKSDLWKTSGHLDHYKEYMFSSIEVDHGDYYLRPMNCPFHISMYKQQQLSYKNLPLRFAELGTVYRYERSGVLHGLMRVRGFTQDDAHIFCTETQVNDEIIAALDLSMTMLNKFGFTEFKVCLSTRPKEKFVGEINKWDLAESALKKALIEKNIPFELDDGGGAFYGPKIDLKIKDSIGRDWQCSTIQFDFNLPEQFNMFYINTNGKKEQPYMIHRALLGSLERFFGILIEHYAGKFPIWLAPIQIRLLFLSEGSSSFKQSIIDKFNLNDIRFDIDNSSEKLSYKIRTAQLEQIPLIAIIGKKELAEKKLTVRLRDSKNQSILTISKLIKKIQNKI